MLEKYLIVEDKKGNLSIVSNQEYRKENDKRLKWDAISGSDEMEEAEKKWHISKKLAVCRIIYLN